HLNLLTGLSRQIIGYHLPPEALFIFDYHVNSLAKEKRELRVLLVASNADRSVAQANQELEKVRNHIEAWYRKNDLQLRIVEIRSHEATIQRVEAELTENGPYQIFHYSGHGRHY